MMRIVIAAGAALLLGACATVEQQQVAESDQAAAKAAPAEASEGDVDMSETICRKEQTTGTRFARRVCKTRQEWEDEAKAIHPDATASTTRRHLQHNRENN